MARSSTRSVSAPHAWLDTNHVVCMKLARIERTRLPTVTRDCSCGQVRASVSWSLAQDAGRTVSSATAAGLEASEIVLGEPRRGRGGKHPRE
jgi:hypothetical protein